MSTRKKSPRDARSDPSLDTGDRKCSERNAGKGIAKRPPKISPMLNTYGFSEYGPPRSLKAFFFQENQSLMSIATAMETYMMVRAISMRYIDTLSPFPCLISSSPYYLLGMNLARICANDGRFLD